MTKADIVDNIAIGTGITKLETEIIIEAFFSTIKNALRDGRTIEIRGFGSFKVKKRKPRLARNPRTGAEVKVDEHYVPIFKVSKDLRGYVNENMKKLEKISLTK